MKVGLKNNMLALWSAFLLRDPASQLGFLVAGALWGWVRPHLPPLGQDCGRCGAGAGHTSPGEPDPPSTIVSKAPRSQNRFPVSGRALFELLLPSPLTETKWSYIVHKASIFFCKSYLDAAPSLILRQINLDWS